MYGTVCNSDVQRMWAAASRLQLRFWLLLEYHGLVTVL